MMRVFFQVHYVAVIAVVAALAGALLLFLIGGFHTFEAFRFALGFEKAIVPATIVAVAVSPKLVNFD